MTDVAYLLVDRAIVSQVYIGINEHATWDVMTEVERARSIDDGGNSVAVWLIGWVRNEL